MLAFARSNFQHPVHTFDHRKFECILLYTIMWQNVLGHGRAITAGPNCAVPTSMAIACCLPLLMCTLLIANAQLEIYVPASENAPALTYTQLLPVNLGKPHTVLQVFIVQYLRPPCVGLDVNFTQEYRKGQELAKMSMLAQAPESEFRYRCPDPCAFLRVYICTN